jgi:hypothetical protein
MKSIRIPVTIILSVIFCTNTGSRIIDRRPAPVIATSDTGDLIRSYGEMFVLDKSPDFYPEHILQVGNPKPKKKIQPLKSWEFGSNYFGATPPRVPRTMHTDKQFQLPVNIIDGNPKTWWVSRGQGAPSVEPEWIRIDLAQDQMISEIVLHPLVEGLSERGVIDLAPTEEGRKGFRYQNPWPQKFTVKVSRDAWHWDTVYENNNQSAPGLGNPVRIAFPQRPVKQIWIIGERLGLFVDGPFRGFWGHCWAVSGIDANGHGGNWARVSRGAVVTTSSTNYGYQGRRQELNDWWSLHYDMGLKWLRMSFWTAVLNWHYVEQKKGVYQIDAAADASITEAVDYGVNVVLGLMYGNWLYTDTPRDNFEGRVEMIPFDPPPSPWKEEHIQGYLNYVRFMVRHFKGRVYAWELWNEPIDNERYGWCCGEKARRKYAEIVSRVIPIIREEDPGSKILASGQLGNMLSLIAPEIDIVDFVRWGGQLPLNSSAYRNQPQQFEEFREWIRGEGFKGDIFFSLENRYHASPYPNPRTHLSRTSEIQQAKILTQTMTRHAALGIVSFWNETWNSALTTGDVGLFRHGFNSGPSHNMTIRPGYYAYRTICTVFADADPDPGLEIELNGKGFPEKTVTYPQPWLGLEGEAVREMVDAWGFRDKDGRRLVALWMKGDPMDNQINQGTHVDVRVGTPASRVVGYDTMNGVEQELNFEPAGNDTWIRNLKVYDYPLVVRIE